MQFAFLRGACGDTFGEIKTKSIGFYGNTDVKLSDTITLTGGLRYTAEDKKLAYAQNGFPGLAPTLPLGRDTLNDEEVSPTASIRFEPLPELSFYGTVSKGFKSGGWNVDNITSAAVTSFAALRFNSESLWNYEIGVKGAFLDRRISFSAAVFQMDYSDIQVSKLEPVLGGGGALVAITTNAGQARIRGFEFETVVIPTDGLRLSGGVGYSDAKYRDYPDIVAGTPVNFAGNEAQQRPRMDGERVGAI